MSRELLLLRHAKTHPREQTQEDKDRALTERGIDDAVLIGKYISQHSLVPHMILCSTATRTVQTLGAVTHCFEESIETIYLKELYSCSPEIMLQLIATHAKDTARRILVVGHSPTIQQCAIDLLKRHTPPTDMDIQLRGGDYPTGTLTRLICDEDIFWHELIPCSATLAALVTPKSLRDDKC